VKEANRTEFRQSSHGGEEMRSAIEFRASPEHDGKVFECWAHNPSFAEPKELSSRITLVVLCKCRKVSEQVADISIGYRVRGISK
jgi:hypothetical protein